MQDDPVKNISNMRTAIENTNVLLNLVICPGIILIPSSMIILKEKVKGYNNYLTLATKEMKFGVNEDVNRVAVRKPTTTQQKEKEEENPVLQTSVIPKVDIPNPVPVTDDVNVLPTLGGAITVRFLIAKYII